MMKKCKCSNLGVDLEKTAKCRCLRQTAVTQLSNKLAKTASSGRKRKAVLASLDQGAVGQEVSGGGEQGGGVGDADGGCQEG